MNLRRPTIVLPLEFCPHIWKLLGLPLVCRYHEEIMYSKERMST
jgi:hypothetical protein